MLGHKFCRISTESSDVRKRARSFVRCYCTLLASTSLRGLAAFCNMLLYTAWMSGLANSSHFFVLFSTLPRAVYLALPAVSNPWGPVLPHNT